MENLANLKNFWKNKKVLVTGHTGFKGSWLVIILKYLNSKIYGYSLKPKKNSLYKSARINKLLSSNTFADINNYIKLKNTIKKIKPEIIFHLAAQPLVLESYKKPLETFNTNIIGTANLLEVIKSINSVKSVVIITTDKVYKINKKKLAFKETSELGGYDPYSTSKVGTEIIVNSYIQSFFQKSKLRNCISTARAGNVVGGGDFSKNRLVPDIINSINNKTKLQIRNPNHIRPWQHVLDPLMGYLLLAKKQYLKKNLKQNHSWNFGPNSRSFKKVMDVIKFMKSKKNFEYKILRKKNYKETEILKLNSKKAHEELKWLPKWNFEDSLKFTIDWNNRVKKGLSAKIVCEQQFLMYINKK